MNKGRTLVLALTLLSVAGSLIASTAATCTPSRPTTAQRQRTATDPFGSCETTSGQVKCGAGTADVPEVGVLMVDQNKGVQACSNDERELPISGRVGVYKDANNNVSIMIDGGDQNSGGAGGWQRYDVRPTDQKVCARRGSGGTYWSGTNSGLGSSNPDAASQGMTPAGPNKTCQGAANPAVPTP